MKPNWKTGKNILDLNKFNTGGIIMKITNGNSQVKYETSDNNLKTTDPQVDYQVNAAENGLFVGDKVKWPKFILLDEHMDRAAKNNFVIGEMGKGRAYHLDLKEIEQSSNPYDGDKTTEPKVDYQVESHIPCDKCETNLNPDSLNKAIEITDDIFVFLCETCFNEWKNDKKKDGTIEKIFNDIKVKDHPYGVELSHFPTVLLDKIAEIFSELNDLEHYEDKTHDAGIFLGKYGYLKLSQVVYHLNEIEKIISSRK